MNWVLSMNSWAVPMPYRNAVKAQRKKKKRTARFTRMTIIGFFSGREEGIPQNSSFQIDIILYNKIIY
jgi:hypothetical protein